MAFTGAEKVFCVLQFAKFESIVIVQHRFHTQYHKDTRTDKPIHTWYNNFEQTGSLSVGKRWIGCIPQDDSPLLLWPPRSPDLTPCDFFLWGYVKNHMLVSPMPLNLAELQKKD